MIIQEVENMPAGYEMDLLVAENIMGWKWFHYEEASYFRRNDVFDYVVIVDKVRGQTCVFNNSLPKFSTDAHDMLSVSDKLNVLGFNARIEIQNNEVRVMLWRSNMTERGPEPIYSKADSIPLAICRAALLATMTTQ